MTVNELIEELKQYPKDVVVRVRGTSQVSEMSRLEGYWSEDPVIFFDERHNFVSIVP